MLATHSCIPKHVTSRTTSKEGLRILVKLFHVFIEILTTPPKYATTQKLAQEGLLAIRFS